MKKVIAFISYMLIFILIWILLDVLWTVVIEKSSYTFTILDSLFMPVTVGALSWLFSGLRRKAANKSRKNKNE
ncbi:MAG: hypothetical protein K6B74_04655 [Ruminococcus sp.]|nr:hypothetical protein [Ruminococcus sp.]